MLNKIAFISKKILFLLFLSTIIVLCVASVRLMYKSNNRYTVQMDDSLLEFSNFSKDDIYIVKKGNLEITMSIDGIVAPINESAITYIPIDTNINGIELCVKQGQELKANDKYAYVWGTEYKVDHSMRCHEIKWREDGCTLAFLDYDKLYIEAMLPQKYIKYDLYSCDFLAKSIGDDDEKYFQIDLDFEDSFINNDQILCRFDISEVNVNLLPGTKVSIESDLETKNDVIMIPAGFVIPTNNDYYVQFLNEDESITNRKVEIGEIKNNMVEIKKGLKEGEQIILPSNAISLAAQLEASHD